MHNFPLTNLLEKALLLARAPQATSQTPLDRVDARNEQREAGGWPLCAAKQALPDPQAPLQSGHSVLPRIVRRRAPSKRQSRRGRTSLNADLYQPAITRRGSAVIVYRVVIAFAG